MGDILPFPPGSSGSAGGSGPEDPMLERRVDLLEEKFARMDAKLSGIELALAEIKGQLAQLPKATDYAALRADIGDIKGRLGHLPTVWTILTITFTTWAIGSGILIFALNILKR
jgi:hypothetical protein